VDTGDDEGRSVAEDFFGGVDDADRGIGRAEGAEFLGVGDEHVGVDDRLVGIAPYQPSIQISTSAFSGQCRKQNLNPRANPVGIRFNRL
jgi:hypothetical protein